MITRLLIFLAALTLGAVPAAAEVLIPSTYQAVYVDCSKQGMDTATLQTKASALKSNQVLRLPDGTCTLDKPLILKGKTNVAMVGGGKDVTILKFVSPYSGGVNIQGGASVFLGDFQVVYDPVAAKRGGAPEHTCFVANIARVGRPKTVTLNGVKGVNCTSAGVLFVGVDDSLITNSEIVRSKADAFHMTNGSHRIMVMLNRAEGPGDDALASIGNKSSATTNQDISFVENEVVNGKANGCHFDNTQGGKCLRNRITDMGLSCAAISADGNWSLLPSNHIEIAGNVCTGTNTRTVFGYGVLSVYSFKSTAQLGPDIVLSGNVIRNPVSGPAVRIWGPGPKSATVTGNQACGLGSRKLLAILSGSLIQSGNTVTSVCQ